MYSEGLYAIMIFPDYHKPKLEMLCNSAFNSAHNALNST